MKKKPKGWIKGLSSVACISVLDIEVDVQAWIEREKKKTRTRTRKTKAARREN